jgi:hypothetical protein
MVWRADRIVVEMIAKLVSISKIVSSTMHYLDSPHPIINQLNHSYLVQMGPSALSIIFCLYLVQ